MRSLLSSKYAQGQLVVISDTTEALKSGEEAIESAMSTNGWKEHGAKSLMICGDTENFAGSESLPVFPASKVTLYDIICRDYVFMTMDAVKEMEQKYISA